jgi:phage I-like protein
MPEFDSTHVDSVIGVVKMPFGEYTNFADCVSKNKGKVSDPEAYCAVIKRKVEGEDINVTNEVLMSLGEIGEDGKLRGAQLMPLGKWIHPLGEIDVTFERAQKFAEQFKRNVAGQNLPVLYIHSDKGNVANPSYGKAAGWMSDVRADPNLGVVIDIDFTPEGREAVNKKEYAYLSAEYFDRVQLPHHDSPQEDVIVGAALVNRPHLKGMNPLLNEETGHQFLLGVADQPIKGVKMDPILRQLAEQAQVTLSDDQTELTEEQSKAIAKFFADQAKEHGDLTAKVSLLEKQLADTQDPEKARQKSLEEAGFVEEAKLLSEVRADKMVGRMAGFLPKDRQFSPVGEEAIRGYALEQTTENLNSLHEVLLNGKGIVDLSEIGSAGAEEDKGDPTSDSLAGEILAESQKIADEQKITLGEATSVYARKNPEKWNEYQKSMGALKSAKMGG